MYRNYHPWFLNILVGQFLMRLVFVDSLAIVLGNFFVVCSDRVVKSRNRN